MPVWCYHVCQYGVIMYASMVSSCMPVWCYHVCQYGVSYCASTMFSSVTTCAPSPVVPKNTSQFEQYFHQGNGFPHAMSRSPPIFYRVNGREKKRPRPSPSVTSDVHLDPLRSVQFSSVFSYWVLHVSSFFDHYIIVWRSYRGKGGVPLSLHQR